MSLANLSRQSLFREIQLQIREYIIDNQMQPGDLLPPAGEMAARLGVSAATLREALRSLETLGVLETRHGVGTFIRAYDFSPILENLSYSLLFERQNLRKLVQLREAMEIGLIAQAIECISDADIQELESILNQMLQPGASNHLDKLFHCTLYRCLDNELILQFLDIFWTVHHNLVDKAMLTHAEQVERWQIHAPILAAVKAKDTTAAYQALVRHFDGIKRQLDRTAPANANSQSRSDGAQSGSDR